MADDIRVYPRVCGGTFGANDRALANSGLSPRVRGNHAGRYPQGSGKRSIPACAGEPFTRPLCVIQATVYPRVCGGTMICKGYQTWRYGLSPRVRGNRSVRKR